MNVSALGEIPVLTVERLVLYRRLLERLAEQGAEFVHSREIAELANNSAAQVRRDLMSIGYMGSPARGYGVADLIKLIGRLFEKKGEQKVALVGIGKLGRAILSYFSLRQPRLKIVAAFDSDPAKAAGEFSGCPCHPIERMPEIIAQNIIVRLSEDLDIPVLTYIVSEQTGEAGMETRLESFVDLLDERRYAARRVSVAG